jgi:hypothetical protein
LVSRIQAEFTLLRIGVRDVQFLKRVGKGKVKLLPCTDTEALYRA